MSSNRPLKVRKGAKTLHRIFADSGIKLSKFYKKNLVYEVKKDGKPKKFVVKVFKCRESAEEEIKHLMTLKNISGVTKVYSYTITDDFSYAIYKRIKGSDLYDIVTNKTGYYAEKDLKVLVKKILKILETIHSFDIVHRDIKPENIVLTKRDNPVIIDFEGWSSELYQSPEQLNDEKITTKSDMWSFGALCFFLATGEDYFPDQWDILDMDIDFKKGMFSKKFIDFLECLLVRNPDARYSAKEALKHVWLN